MIIGRDKGELVEVTLDYKCRAGIHESAFGAKAFMLNGELDEDGDCLMEHHEGWIVRDELIDRMPSLEEKKRYLYVNAEEISNINKV
jgi:hypothetical protein